MRLIDALLGSKELKRELVERSFEFGIPFKMICNEVGIEYKVFMASYINSHESPNSEITEEQLKEVMALLGMQVRYQFVIDKSFDHAAVKQKLVNKENEKKGIITKIE